MQYTQLLLRSVLISRTMAGELHQVLDMPSIPRVAVGDERLGA